MPYDYNPWTGTLDKTARERLALTDLSDVTVTSAAQYQLLQINGDGEWVNITDLNLGAGTISTTGTLGAGASTFGTSTNYSQFEADGTLEFNGTATVWDDLVTPFTLAKVPAANAPNWESFIGNLNAYTFAVDDYLEGTTEILHGWKESSTIDFHIHWATNGLEEAEKAVKWQIEFTYADMDADDGVGEAFGATTTESSETAIPASTADLTHMYTIIHNVELTSTIIGAQILWRVTRKTADGTAPVANPFAFAVGIHYEKDTVGSREITTK